MKRYADAEGKVGGVMSESFLFQSLDLCVR